MNSLCVSFAPLRILCDTTFKLLFFSLILLATSCDRDEPSALQKNNSVLPADFLSNKTFTKLQLEIVYVQGFPPSSSAINNLKVFLETHLNKASVTVTQRSIPSPGNQILSAESVRDLEKVHRRTVTDGDNLTAFIYYADGEYSQNQGNTKVLGIAYGASSICVFQKTVNELGGGFGSSARAALETVVVSHEFGHLLGLVNNGTSMVAPHQDNAHAAHCTATDCLMYYKAETNAVQDIISGGVPSLDAFCKADLKAAGGK